MNEDELKEIIKSQNDLIYNLQQEIINLRIKLDELHDENKEKQIIIERLTPLDEEYYNH